MRKGDKIGYNALSPDAVVHSDRVGAVEELFCDGCGYSLTGLTAERCPECGREFDANAPRLAEVPWLHRRRIGGFKAYVDTLGMALITPTKFALELARPVRGSLEDALKFRSVTLWIATASFAVVVIVLPVVALQTSSMPAIFARNSLGRVAHGVSTTLLSVAAFYLFVRLLTDMPLFIWPGSSQSRMRPVQCYACAPLALLPVPATPLAVWFYVLMHRDFMLHFDFNLASLEILVAWLLWFWGTSLFFMAVSHSASRVLVLALYLPIHFVFAFIVSMAVFSLSFAGVRFVLGLLFG